MKKDDQWFNISTDDKSSESYGKPKQVGLKLYIRNNFSTMRFVIFDVTRGISLGKRLTYICGIYNIP